MKKMMMTTFFSFLNNKKTLCEIFFTDANILKQALTFRNNDEIMIGDSIM